MYLAEINNEYNFEDRQKKYKEVSMPELSENFENDETNSFKQHVPVKWTLTGNTNLWKRGQGIERPWQKLISVMHA